METAIAVLGPPPGPEEMEGHSRLIRIKARFRPQSSSIQPSRSRRQVSPEGEGKPEDPAAIFTDGYNLSPWRFTTSTRWRFFVYKGVYNLGYMVLTTSVTTLHKGRPLPICRVYNLFNPVIQRDMFLVGFFWVFSEELPPALSTLFRL